MPSAAYRAVHLRHLQSAYAVPRRMRYDECGVAEHRCWFSSLSHAGEIIRDVHMQPKQPEKPEGVPGSLFACIAAVEAVVLHLADELLSVEGAWGPP
jgi:hypothetical protein